MVKISLIKQNNSKIDASSVPAVAVFVGATSGIGKFTLGSLARLGFPFKAYVVGRKETKQAFSPFLEELRKANAAAELIWTEGQVSLLSDVKRICDEIKSRESKIDLLFLTAGYI